MKVSRFLLKSDSRAVRGAARVGTLGEDGEVDGEELVVDESRVDGEDGHEQNAVAPAEGHLHDVAEFLQGAKTRFDTLVPTKMTPRKD